MATTPKGKFNWSLVKEIAEAYAVAGRMPTDKLVTALSEVSGMKEYDILLLFEEWWGELSGIKSNPYEMMRR
jgi:hypothetical protein